MNARLTYAQRLDLARSVAGGQTIAAAAANYRVSTPTARKWVRRYRLLGARGLTDMSSRPHFSPKSLSDDAKIRIREMRRSGLRLSVIAALVACSVSTVSRICALAKINAARPPGTAHANGALNEHEPSSLARVDTGCARASRDRNPDASDNNV